MTTPKNPLDKVLNRYSFPEVRDVSVAVLDGGQIHTTTSGCSDQALFQAASISKPVAALAALILVDEKKLDLDEDINSYLTSWKLPDAVTNPVKFKVTLRHLLSHSGALSVMSFAGYPHNVQLPTLVQILDGLPPANNGPVRRKGTPGVEERYSGGGTTVLQQLLQDVSHLPLPELVKQKVFTPLGMSTATYTEPAAAMAKGRIGLTEIPDGWRRYPELAAAGLWCTPTDLVKFAQGIQACIAGQPTALIKDHQLTQDIVTEQVPGWGLGVELGGKPHSRRFWHGGQNEGYLCRLEATVDGGKVIAVMTASDHGDQVIHPLVPRLRQLFSWPDSGTYAVLGSPDGPPASFGDQQALDFAYSGSYELPDKRTIRVRGVGTNWSIQVQGKFPEPIEPISPTEAISPTRELEVEFDLDVNGVATGLTVREGGTSQDATRL